MKTQERVKDDRFSRNVEIVSPENLNSKLYVKMQFGQIHRDHYHNSFQYQLMKIDSLTHSFHQSS